MLFPGLGGGQPVIFCVDREVVCFILSCAGLIRRLIILVCRVEEQTALSFLISAEWADSRGTLGQDP